jgi:hypothetical protein
MLALRVAVIILVIRAERGIFGALQRERTRFLAALGLTKAALGMTSVEVLANNEHSHERAFLCASVVKVS